MDPDPGNSNSSSLGNVSGSGSTKKWIRNTSNSNQAEEEDVFTDSTLFREAAEQLDAADEQVPVTVPMITVPVPAVPGGSPTQGTQESSFEWNNSTAPMSVASQGPIV